MLKYRLLRSMLLLMSLSLALNVGLWSADGALSWIVKAAGPKESIGAAPSLPAAGSTTIYVPLMQMLIAPIRVDAASTTSYVDSAGNPWEADRGYLDGFTTNFGNISVANTNDPKIYQTERYGLTGYAFPVVNGPYTVRLHFAENYAPINGPGLRVFDVDVEGVALNKIDIYAETGGQYIALVKTVTVSVTDNRLDIKFTPIVQGPIIDGIVVIPQ